MTALVTIRDLRSALYCSRGSREFFARHNLDWNAFLHEGIDEQLLLATGDEMARRIVEVARGRRKQEGNSRV